MAMIGKGGEYLYLKGKEGMGSVCIGLVYRTGAQERKSVSWMGRDELLLGSCSGYSTGT
jgi:hypothetical protein